MRSQRWKSEDESGRLIPRGVWKCDREGSREEADVWVNRTMTLSKVREIRWDSTDRLQPEVWQVEVPQSRAQVEEENMSDVDYLILDRKDLPQEPSHTLGM
jgi:hypothetical protein